MTNWKIIVMTMNDKIADYITFPKTFEKYRWYKPILVFVLTIIIMSILSGLTIAAFYKMVGPDFLRAVLYGGYEILVSPMAMFFMDLIIIMFIPSLYIASKVVKDRPFSSYSSSRGGWNFKLYFKALIIPMILFIVYMIAETAIKGPEGTSNFSIAFLLLLFISVPLQCIAEEYMFRGFIMQTFGAWFKMPVLAIVLQAILFTVCHQYNILGLFETLVTGLGFGFLAWKTNGLEISSALHTANNFAVGLFVMLGLKASTSSPQLWEVVASIVFLIILFIIMYYVGNKTNWFGEISENSQNR